MTDRYPAAPHRGLRGRWAPHGGPETNGATPPPEELAAAPAPLRPRIGDTARPGRGAGAPEPRHAAPPVPNGSVAEPPVLADPEADDAVSIPRAT